MHYVVTDHQGTPREIFSEKGIVSWAGRLNTWGQMAFWQSHDDYADNDPEYTECHFRFAGQYEDKESGLYYNRFRYYDKDTGQYISPDPIGLLGGFNPYGYVYCPTGWIDPFGLSGTSKLEEKTVAVFRVETEHINSKRIFIDDKGNVSIPDTEKMLFLNFGEESRAMSFRNLEDGEKVVNTFNVRQSFLEKLNTIAIKERDLRKSRENKGLPLRVDIRKAPNQYGLRTEQINELLDGNIIQGSGKKS